MGALDLETLFCVGLQCIEDQILPHWPWSLTGVTTPFFLIQSMDDGTAKTFSYLKDEDTLASKRSPFVAVAGSCELFICQNTEHNATQNVDRDP
ncbi:hypothetical protein Scep_011599 [Stephania cephalantha]|uniref:Uncharacterized protein n=1 Tax=Stephania cephalantha TaxID=152367 RepID=A0AAP0P929_9MAGN